MLAALLLDSTPLDMSLSLLPSFEPKQERAVELAKKPPRMPRIYCGS